MRDGSIEWTGERCVPWADDLAAIYEHYHRYAVTARYVRGKRVLDLACGEGYGAALLATEAEEVVGVDLDEDAVTHARQRYGARRVEFHTGSITDPELLAGNGAFDVVVCFGAIERVDDPEAVLELVRSRLKPGGLFVASTPDLAVRGPEHSDDNAFRAVPEFGALLKDTFRHVAILRQNVAVGSVLVPADPGDPDAVTEGVRLQTLRHEDGTWQVRQGVPHTTLIGFASERQLPRLPAAAALLDADQNLVRQDLERSTTGRRGLPAADLSRVRDSQHHAAEDVEPEARAAVSERRRIERWGVDSEQDEHDALRAELDRVTGELHRSQQHAERADARIEWLRDTVSRLEGRATQAQQQAAEFAERNADLADRRSVLARWLTRKWREVVQGVAPRSTTHRDVSTSVSRRYADSAPARRPAETGPIVLPRATNPVVSVIILVGGNWGYTRRCLRFVAGHSATVPFEVIVVDDRRADTSAQKLADCDGVRLVRAERPLGFADACNLAAENARGAHLFFLDKATEVTESWLDTLVCTVERDEAIGLVGAKSVYPDGRMREAGGIIWSDGTGWSFGRGGDPAGAEFNTLRDVDYCSDAAILVRAEVFDRVGGFDRRFAPAHYEDTDLAFAVRDAGYRTVVQPRAVVVQHEERSPDTEPDGDTRSPEAPDANRETFRVKWAETLAVEQLPGPSARNLWLGHQRGAHGHHSPLVLVKGDQVPDAQSSSGRLRRLLTQFRALGCRVVFFPGNHGRPEPHTTQLQQLGVTVLPGSELQRAFLQEVGSEISLALLSGPQVAWSLVERLRTRAPRALIVYDAVDVRFSWLGQQAELAAELGDAEQAEALRREALASRQLELGLARCCDVTLVTSDAERDVLAEFEPAADLRVVSNAYEVGRAPVRPQDSHDVVFAGDIEHPPNLDAARWAAREVMPLVWEHFPDAELHVTSSNSIGPPHELETPGVTVHGPMAGPDAWYAGGRVTLAPLRFGIGAHGVVGESLAAGVPVVGTSAAVEGLRLGQGDGVQLAEDAAGLAAAVVNLLADDASWQRTSNAGRDVLAARFGSGIFRDEIRDLLESAGVPRG